MNVEIKDNTGEVQNRIGNALHAALTAIGIKCADYASDKVPVDTGRLKNSINYEVDDKSVIVGTNVDYAAYVELGTGKYSTQGGRPTPWRYQDGKGDWHTTSGQKPQPYLKPAASEHTSEYGDILRDMLKNG